MSDEDFIMYQDFISGAISGEDYQYYLKTKGKIKNENPETLLAQTS